MNNTDPTNKPGMDSDFPVFNKTRAVLLIYIYSQVR